MTAYEVEDASVVCPFCGADYGRPCTDALGVRRPVHLERVHAAAATYDALEYDDEAHRG